jgi:hypothetical protein
MRQRPLSRRRLIPVLCLLALAAPLAAADGTEGFDPPPPAEQALLAPLAKPEILPWTIAGAGVCLAGGAALSVWSLYDLGGRAMRGMGDPAVQNDLVGLVSGMVVAGVFAALIDAAIRTGAEQAGSAP